MCLVMAALCPTTLLAGQSVNDARSAQAHKSSRDAQSYCQYLNEQAMAQRDLLRTPMASAGFTQPEEGLPIQLVAGASLGLSEYKKAGLTMEVGRRNCELYRATTDAQQDIQYAAAALEKDAMRNRLALIERASAQLDGLMDKTRQMIDAQNATRQMLFALQTSRIKLEADRADTQAKIAALYTPVLSERPLSDLVRDKQSGEVAEQKALDKLNRQNNWDVALQVGVHQQVNPVAQGAQPYGSVSVSYNLASHAIDRHLDRAVEAWSDWKKVQEGDVARNAEVLRQQLADGVAANEARLKALEQQGKELDANLAAVAAPDTSAALDFNNQLTAAKLLLEIETGDATYREAHLSDYLAKNY
jgi:D-alanyl-D-alanine dipeptidase